MARHTKKQSKSTLILLAVFAVGIFLLLYPSVSNYWNSFHATRAITGYTQQVSEMDNATYQKILGDARAYNETLLTKSNRYNMSEADKLIYESMLNFSTDEVMAYIDIPSIRVTLPIYHGVEERALQVGVGHIPGSSLPVGGPSTHCVLSGHRGLPSAKLFTSLDKLVEGDVFMIYVLDETLTYEVDQILIVEPEQMSSLVIEEGQDYCTLVTCTPYGVNSHRLLVRGHRVANASNLNIRVTADALQITPTLVAPFVAIPVLLLLLVYLIWSTRKPKQPNLWEEQYEKME